jgi:hypothetical protein
LRHDEAGETEANPETAPRRRVRNDRDAFQPPGRGRSLCVRSREVPDSAVYVEEDV